MKRAIGKARMFKLICLLEDGIGIVGSPRKNGNVDTLVSRVLEGAREAGLDTSKYLLNEMKYSGCQACEYCKSHDHSRLDDDVTRLFEEMKEADAVVFGSPIYFFLFSGQFKRMEDRMYSLKMLGFEVVDIIRMVDGITPDAVLAKGELLEMARSAGAGLGGS